MSGVWVPRGCPQKLYSNEDLRNLVWELYCEANQGKAWYFKFDPRQIINNQPEIVDEWRPLTSDDFIRARKESRRKFPTTQTFQQRLGSTLPEICRALGIKFQAGRKKAYRGYLEVKSHFQNFVNELGRLPSKEEVEANSVLGRCPSIAAIERFTTLERLCRQVEMPARSSLVS